MSKSVAERWNRIAETEPYYAVLSHDRYLLSRMKIDSGEFFATGERDVEYVLHLAEASGRSTPIETVLEFGCGPGRLLPSLAQRGFEVTAVDISPGMVALAEHNAHAHGAYGVDVIDLPTLMRSDTTFDLIVVNRVLQHMSASDATATLRLVVRYLKQDGLIYVNAPVSTRRRMIPRAALRARQYLGVVNQLANRIKKRPLHVPVLPPCLHSLDSILGTLHQSSLAVGQLSIKDEGELTTVHLIARNVYLARPAQLSRDHNDQAVASLDDSAASSYISPTELIRSITVEEMSARAEAYFARTDSWKNQLAKPFGSIDESPVVLISLGVLMQGMQLAPGMTVLDFGGGTGWLSRTLCELGCNAILCDVSATALRIATRDVEQYPLRQRGTATFTTLLFDGHHIDLPDASIDRIVCFDSFHHVPNAAEILSEFARILRPGGIAAFSEPGPEHSRSAQSQFEMRVHGVLENDIDIASIWSAASALGFDDLRVAPFDGGPRYLPLVEFDDFLAGGRTMMQAAGSLRSFASNVRTFILHRTGWEPATSRTAAGVECHIEVELEDIPRVSTPTAFAAIVTNTGKSVWMPSGDDPGGVSLGAHLYTGEQLCNFDFLWIELSSVPVPPSGQISVKGMMPPLPPGRHVIEFDCVAKSVRWFSQMGSPVARLEIVLE